MGPSIIVWVFNNNCPSINFTGSILSNTGLGHLSNQQLGINNPLGHWVMGLSGLSVCLSGSTGSVIRAGLGQWVGPSAWVRPGWAWAWVWVTVSWPLLSLGLASVCHPVWAHCLGLGLGPIITGLATINCHWVQPSQLSVCLGLQ